MKFRLYSKSVSLAAMAAASLLSAPAFAQAPAEGEEGVIIVTAGKRNEDIRQVAMPISAVTDENSTSSAPAPTASTSDLSPATFGRTTASNAAQL